MSAPEPIAIVTALPEELAPLLARVRKRQARGSEDLRVVEGELSGRRVLLASTGDGARNAEAGMRALTAVFREAGVAGWIGAGLCGALTPGLPPGTILVARCLRDGAGLGCPGDAPHAEWTARVLGSGGSLAAIFVSTVQIVATAREKAVLRERIAAGGDAAAAVADMESWAWAVGAASSGIPGILVRSVFDAAEEDVPGFVTASSAAEGAIDRRAIALHALRHPSVIGKLLAMRRRFRSCASRLADYLERLASRGFAL
jgi:nucleoside phosphorylase